MNIIDRIYRRLRPGMVAVPLAEHKGMAELTACAKVHIDALTAANVDLANARQKVLAAIDHRPGFGVPGRQRGIEDVMDAIVRSVTRKDRGGAS